MEDDLSVSSDDPMFIRINVPELCIEKCLQVHRSELVWDIKQQCLASVPKELKEGFNYGLFYPPQNGRAGKFLDEARPISDYPFAEPIGYLELKYKKRVYKMLKLDEKQLRAAHTRANLRRFLDHVTGGHAEKVTKMCAKGLDPNFHCAETGETPLTLCAGLKNPSRVIMALVNGGALLDYRSRDGATAIHRAVAKNNYEALKTLLDLGASPNYQDGKGLTPLYYSIIHNADPAITQALLYEYATVGSQDSQGWAEVHQAARRSMTQHLEHLLFYGADMNAQNASGNTPLHVCAINNEEQCARVLLFRGADKEALNYANQTPYQVAVIADNMELAELILQHRPQDVVPFKESPKYNPRRRAGLALPRTHSESRLSSPLSKPPSPSPSNRSLPPFSSASSLSETSTGSSGTCTHPNSDTDPTPTHGKDLFDVVSESSGVGTSNGSGSGESCDTNPADTVPLCGAGNTVVCIQRYAGSATAGHLDLEQGDIIEVLASTDSGLLEGCLNGQVGLFPAECVQEVRLRRPAQTSLTQSCLLPATDRERGVYAPSLGTGYGTAPRQRRPPLQARTVVLHRGRRGFGFVLRGAKSSSPLMELQPTDRCPALQYLDEVDPGGVAEMAGLKKFDFLLAINGVDVTRASHEFVVEQIRKAGDLVAMTVVSLPDPAVSMETSRSYNTLPRKFSAASLSGRPPIPPLPPKRDPRTTLSVGRARARSMITSYPEIDALDRAIHDYDSEGRSTNSSSLDSETYRVPSVKVASIRSRPTSSRLSSRELEELFARQGSAPRYPPTAGQGGPRVYTSVAEMKRHFKGKKNKGSSAEVASPPDLGGLRKEFHSTPDLQNSGEPWTERRRSHSQEDLQALQQGPGARLGLQGAWSSVERMYGRARTRSGSETSEDRGSGGVRRPRHVKSRDLSRQQRAGRAEYAAPAPASARRLPSTFRPADQAKLYASPTEVRPLAFQTDTTDAATLRRRQQARSQSVPPAGQRADEPPSEPSTPTPTSSETTPTNAPSQPTDLSELYARPHRRPQPEDSPPPPPPAGPLDQKPPPSPRSVGSLQALLAQKVAERRRRLSLGEPAGTESEGDGGGDRVEQVTRIQVGRSGIPAPACRPQSQTHQGMTKSHTLASLSGGDLRLARAKLRSPRPALHVHGPAKPEPEEGDNSSSGVSSDQDQGGQAKYVTYIPTDGAPYTRRHEESEESESSDDTSDRTWILSSERPRADPPGKRSPSSGGLPRPTSGGEPRKPSSIPSLASPAGGRPTARSLIPSPGSASSSSSSVPVSSLSAKSGAAKPVSISVPGGRPARDAKQLRFGGTTTVVISGSPEPEPESESAAQRLGAESGPLPVVPPPPGFDSADPPAALIAPPPEFSDQPGRPGPQQVPSPGRTGASHLPTQLPSPSRSAPQQRLGLNRQSQGQQQQQQRQSPPKLQPPSRLAKPSSLALRSRSPGSPGPLSPPGTLSPPGASGGPLSPTGTAGGALSPPGASGIPLSPSGPSGPLSPPGPSGPLSPRGGGSGIPRRPGPGVTSPSRLPGRAGLQRPSPGHQKNRFRTLPVAQWTVEDTCDWLESLFMPEYKGRFVQERVDGRRLLQLDTVALAELGVKRMGHRMNIEKSLKRLTVSAPVRSPNGSR